MKTLKPKLKTLDTRKGGKIATDRIRGYELQKIRERILLRDDYTCKHCGRVSVDLEIDHIIPLYLGGKEDDNNRQALCNECHAIKSAGGKTERN
ncbi:MAG: HNH endonuclease [Smithella sp. PtaU1.Bin162]|nr:MAG: HNH endonuclease [Smithella sp. PtaU1.Bin162]